MTRADFIAFLKTFKADLQQNKSDWENVTLENFLEAMIAYTEGVQGYYDNMHKDIDADKAAWENFKTILEGAAVYE